MKELFTRGIARGMQAFRRPRMHPHHNTFRPTNNPLRRVSRRARNSPTPTQNQPPAPLPLVQLNGGASFVSGGVSTTPNPAASAPPVAALSTTTTITPQPETSTAVVEPTQASPSTAVVESPTTTRGHTSTLGSQGRSGTLGSPMPPLMGMGARQLLGSALAVPSIQRRFYSTTTNTPQEAAQSIATPQTEISTTTGTAQEAETRAAAGATSAMETSTAPDINNNQQQEESITAELANLRAGLKSPDAINRFDKIVNEQSKAKALHIFKKMMEKSDLEQKLVRPNSNSNRSLNVDNSKFLERIDKINKTAENIFKELEPFHKLSGVLSMIKAMKGDLGFVNKPDKEFTEENIRGIEGNINGHLAVLNVMKEQKDKGLTSVGKKFYYGDENLQKVDIDVVSDNGLLWIEVKNIEMSSVNIDGLIDQIKKQSVVAKQNKINNVVPKIIVYFAKGVTKEIRDSIKKIPGVENVEGEIVDITKI